MNLRIMKSQNVCALWLFLKDAAGTKPLFPGNRI